MEGWFETVLAARRTRLGRRSWQACGVCVGGRRHGRQSSPDGGSRLLNKSVQQNTRVTIDAHRRRSSTDCLG